MCHQWFEQLDFLAMRIFFQCGSSAFSFINKKGAIEKRQGSTRLHHGEGGATWQLDRSLKMALPKRKSCQGCPIFFAMTWRMGDFAGTWKYSVNHPPGFGDDPTMVINHLYPSPEGWSSKYELPKTRSEANTHLISSGETHLTPVPDSSKNCIIFRVCSRSCEGKLVNTFGPGHVGSSLIDISVVFTPPKSPFKSLELLPSPMEGEVQIHLHGMLGIFLREKIRF